MATRIDLSEFKFLPIAALDSTGARLAVAELPMVSLFDTRTGRTIEEFRWVHGDPETDDKPTWVAADEDGDEEDEEEDEDGDDSYDEEELYENLGIPVLVAFSNDAKHFFVGCSHYSGSQGHNDCYLFDVTRAGAPLRYINIEQSMRANNIASRDYNYNDPAAARFTEDGSEIAIVGSFGVVFFSVFEERSRWLRLPDARDKSDSTYVGRERAAIAFRERRAALAWCDSLWLFDLDDLSRVRQIEAPGTARFGSFVSFRDDDTVVVSSIEYMRDEVERRDVHTVDLRTNEWLTTALPAPLRWLSRDGREALCVSGESDELLRFNVVTGEAAMIPRAKSGKNAGSSLLSISEDGTTVARTLGGSELGADARRAIITRRVKKS